MDTFFIVAAGASATLVGLLFVAVSIGPPLARSGPVGPRHAIARSTFTVYALLFMLSLFFLIPGISVRARAVAALAAAGGGAIRAVRTWIPVWRDKFQGRIELRLWQSAWLLVGPLFTYGLLAHAGVDELQQNHPHRFVVNASLAFVLLFMIALRNSWNLLVEAADVARA